MFRLVLVVAIAVPLTVHAEPARAANEPISIDQLLTVAVRRSSALTFVRSSRRLSDLSVKTAGAAGEWQMQASSRIDTKHEPVVANGQAAGAIQSVNLTGTVGLAKQIWTGAELTLAVDSTRQARSAGDSSSTGVLSTVGLQLRQPLLRGLAQGANVAEHKAKLAADATRLQAIDTSASLVLDLLSAYWELAFAHAALDVRTKSLALAENQLDITRKMYERGTVPESAIKSARYGVALREEAKLRAQHDVQSASLRLRKLAGFELDANLGDLVPTDSLVASALGDNVEMAISEALEHSPKIAAAQIGVSIADVDLQSARNGALPGLDLSANASVLGAGPNPGMSFQALSTGASYQVGGEVTLQFSLGGAARATANAARINRSDAKTTAKDVEREVIANVIDVVNGLDAAKQRARVADRAIDLAEANLDTELALFRADKSNNVQVFQRQTELDEARLLASRAAADALIARATLDYLTGNLLERYGVEVMSSSKGARHAVP